MHSKPEVKKFSQESKTVGNLKKYIASIFSNVKSTTSSEMKILIAIIIVCILLYFLFHSAIPFFKSKINQAIFSQGGKELISNPKNLDSPQSIGNYLELNNVNENQITAENPMYNYHYAISAWVYIQSNYPDSPYNQYISILNYGGKPNILYNSVQNTLIITMPREIVIAKNANAKKTIVEGDFKGLTLEENEIVFVKKDFPLQKWNNIIVNYNGGTLDVFLNGELVKTVLGKVPYMSYDTLTVGEKNGILGQIKNVLYFHQELSISQIYYLYNLEKIKNFRM
jgi:hypothetical protein